MNRKTPNFASGFSKERVVRDLGLVAGQLLGLSVHSGMGFPVGKVDVLKMYPMTFSEFVWAQKGEDAFKALTESKMEELASLHSLFKDLFFKLFVVDCGLLGAMTSTPPEGILVGDNIFEEYKGPLLNSSCCSRCFRLPKQNLFTLVLMIQGRNWIFCCNVTIE